MTLTYTDLESARVIVLAGFEPEEESPIVFLRLRKAARTHGTEIVSIAPFASRGLAKMSGRLIPTVPGGEAQALNRLTGELPAGAIILVGERLAGSPGALSAASRLADTTGSRLAWIPRRAGERGALEAGCLPNLLPGGRPVTDGRAREQIANAWGTTDLPAALGRDTSGILAAAGDGTLGALLIGGVEPADLPDPDAALAAIGAAPFVVSLELRGSAVTELADVVLPVAPAVEKNGSFLNWEGRIRAFSAVLPTDAMSDAQLLHVLAAESGINLACPTPAVAGAELGRLGSWEGRRSVPPNVPDGVAPRTLAGTAILAGWRMLLDGGRLQDGEPNLAGTAHSAVARLAAVTAAEIGAAEGDSVIVSTDRGRITLPLEITEMPLGVVWVPLNSPESNVYAELGVSAGAVVRIRREPR